MSSLKIQTSPAVRIRLLGQKIKEIKNDKNLITPPPTAKEGTEEHDMYTFIPIVLIETGDNYTQKQRLEMIQSLLEIIELHSKLPSAEQKPAFIKEIDSLYSLLCRHSRMWHDCRQIRDTQF